MAAKSLIHNEPVELNDLVHDVILGTGEVVSLHDDGAFEVSFGGNRVMYQNGGFLGGRQRLFWSNPVLYVPKKNEQDRVKLIRELVALVLKHVG